jgi:hypothetical protein
MAEQGYRATPRSSALDVTQSQAAQPVNPGEIRSNVPPSRVDSLKYGHRRCAAFFHFARAKECVETGNPLEHFSDFQA